MSLIVPVRGDEGPLAALLAQVPTRPDVEVVVSHAGPAGAATTAIRAQHPHVRWIEGPTGRGVQLNAGAAVARGRWLWFVHADSHLPADWIDAFGRLEARREVVGGAFAFRLDSTAWQARWLEHAVAWRVRLFGLPYGDQGIFVRHPVFKTMGGFSPLPLMEDVEFVGRLKRQGRVTHLSEGMVTSARRWETRGWLGQSLSNLATLALYFVGVSPEWLARRYDRRPNVP